jgi:phage terminase large subunit
MRYKIIRGGRGSGKSWAVARALVLKAAERKRRILCTREFQNSIGESVHELLSSQIRAMHMGHRFEIQQQAIRGLNGSEIFFCGLGSAPEKVMSMEAIDIAWVEQAERLSERSWQILIPTVRRPGSEIWATFNPDEEGDPTYQRFVVNTPPDCISLEVNWRENPWFPPELERERAYLFSVDPESAENVWNGVPRSNQSAQILRGKYAIESFTPPSEGGRQLWDGPYYGCDFGFANDPTTLVRCWISGAQFGKTQGRLYVEHEAWGIGVEIANTPALFDTVPEARKHLIYADCARPETISHIHNAGFRIEPCEKWKGSVEDGVSYLRSFEKIIIHPRCSHAAEEARLYSFKRDRLTGIVMPDVADKNNHIWDAVRYALGRLVRPTTSAAIWARL